MNKSVSILLIKIKYTCVETNPTIKTQPKVHEPDHMNQHQEIDSEHQLDQN
jgi:hypothetical protein